MIYFDNSATTALCPEAIKGIMTATEIFGNPSSLHYIGQAAEKLLYQSRDEILKASGADSSLHTLIFTSCGSESNNLAVLGCASSKNYKNPKIIITDSEHPSIMQPCRYLEEKGFEICRLSTRNGKIDIDEFKKEMTENVILVSIMLVNNETGAVYDVKTIFEEARKINKNVVCHTDAVQAFLKIPFTMKAIGADMMTLSSHKIHGPKGCGALVLGKKLLISKRISPWLLGGGQEGGMRSGTENMPGISGFAAAATAKSRAFKDDYNNMNDLRNYIISLLPESVTVNSAEKSAPHILNITLPDIKSETMLNFLSSKDICVSSGSACSSHGKHGSYVLRAFGLDEKKADTSLRISLCGENTKQEADIFAVALKEGINTLIPIHR